MKKIAFIGAPGAGKTTITSGLFYNLKILGKKTEIVPELVKYKVYQNSNFKKDGFDIKNTLEQQELEFQMSSVSNIEILICEAPLCNGFFYSSFYKKKEEWPILKKIAKENINSYDLIFFLKHINNSYESFGRKESKETSYKLEKFIKKKLKELNYKNKLVFIDQKTNIFSIINVIENL